MRMLTIGFWIIVVLMAAVGLLVLLAEGGLFNYALIAVVVVVGGWLSFRQIALRRHLSRVSGQERQRVAAPVDDGTWEALNSPTTAIPSHGTHAYGQTFAIDIWRVDGHPVATELAWNEPADTYPSFGVTVVAPVDGVVVRVRDGARDHRARVGVAGLCYIAIESYVRSLGGPQAVIGNHIVIRASDTGYYVLLAHVRRGSAQVAEGDRVQAGQPIAACGNSGNSSEPHVHLQVQTARSTLAGFGVPFDFLVDGEATAPPGNDCQLNLGSTQ